MNKVKILPFGSFPPPYHASSIYLEQLTNLLKKDKEFKVFIYDLT